MSGFDWPWSRQLRPVLQAEAAECGLACLTMVADHHGHRVDLAGSAPPLPRFDQGRDA
jgi:ATP-binding cassette subfamily B protein RaxB